jgi:hypothetical protein
LHPPDQPTFEALLSLWLRWLSYAVSYLFIAIVWANHHHLMGYATEAGAAIYPQSGDNPALCGPGSEGRFDPLGQVALLRVGKSLARGARRLHIENNAPVAG